MSAGDLAAVLVAVVCLVAVVALLVAAQALIGALRSLRRALDQLHDETIPAVVELRRTAAATNAGLARADQILAHAEGITTSLDATSRFAHRMVSSPAIKVMAAASGTRRAAHRLRRRS